MRANLNLILLATVTVVCFMGAACAITNDHHVPNDARSNSVETNQASYNDKDKKDGGEKLNIDDKASSQLPGKQPPKEINTNPEPTYCFHLLWAKNQKDLDTFRDSLGDESEYVQSIKEWMTKHPNMFRENQACLKRTQIPDKIWDHLNQLDPGELSDPFQYGMGIAIVYGTTDKFYVLGLKQIKNDQLDDAKDNFLDDLELNPNNVSSWHYLALIYKRQGEYEDALKAVNSGLAWMPDHVPLLDTKANILMKMGEVQEALQVSQAAHKFAPGNPSVCNNLAWNLLQAEQDLPWALELARTAVDKDKDNPNYWDTLGRIQSRLNMPAEAVVSFHKALSLDSDMAGSRELMLQNLLLLQPSVVVRLQSKDEISTHKSSQSKKINSKTRLGKGSGQKQKRLSASPPKHGISTPPVGPARRADVSQASDNQPVYYIQTASFSRDSSAQEEMSDWRKKGYPGVVKKWVSANGKLWYRSLVGPFSDSAKAKSEAIKLRESGQLKDYIIVERFN